MNLKQPLDEITKNPAQSLTRRQTLSKFSVGLAGTTLIGGALCVTGFGPKQYRLGGAWIGGRPGFQWSAIEAPLDPAGRTCATRGMLKQFDAQFAGLLAAFGADNLSDAVGQARMISPDTAEWTLVAYAQATPQAPGDLLQTTAIILYSGAWQYTSEDTAVLTYAVNIYPASADADDDGYPDANAEPALRIDGVVDNARRAPIL